MSKWVVSGVLSFLLLCGGFILLLLVEMEMVAGEDVGCILLLCEDTGIVAGGKGS